MKKNIAMFFVTFCVAIFSFVIAIVAFFKKKRYFWNFENEDDLNNANKNEEGNVKEEQEKEVAKNSNSVQS